LVQTFLTTLVTVLAAVGLYVGWTAWHHLEPVETATRAPLPQVEDVAATPTSLGPMEATAMEATLPVDRQSRDDCVVKIVGQGNTLAGAVVGILDATSGAHLACQPLSAQKLPLTVRFPNIPDGEHWVALARNDAELRFAYLDRARLKRRPRAGGHRTALLRGQVHDLSVELLKEDSNSICTCVAVLLRRPDDSDWRYREPEGREDSTWLLLTDDAGKIQLRQLGAGRYLLRIEGFELPGIAAEWMPVTLDRDRTLRLTGAAR
jgi:hypothetical protein